MLQTAVHNLIVEAMLLGLSQYIALKMLQTTVRNLIVEAMLPTREIVL